MLNRIEFGFDANEYLKSLNLTFGSKKTQQVAKRIAGLAGGLLKKETKVQLRKKIGKKAKQVGTRFALYGSKKKNATNVTKKNGVITGIKTLENRIVARTQTEGVLDAFSKVHVMADPRLRWLERGTYKSPKRTTKKGLNRGTVQPTHYFETARQITYPKIKTQTEKILNEMLHSVWNGN